MGAAADVERDGEEAVLRTTLGAAFEGAPGRAHGGIVAALFDEVMGFVLSVHATTAYTGNLTVTYRAPTPIGVELELRSRLRSRHGRKLRIVAEARHGETLVAEADGLFIAVDPARFAQG
jgi:acyl-coenzyme A thioesterase PaaI-like protein